MRKNKKYLIICPSYPPPLVGGHKVWTYNMVEHGFLDFDILTSSLKKGFSEVSSPRHNMIRKSNIFSGKGDSINPSLWDLFISYSYMITWIIKKRFSFKYTAVIVHACTFANGIFFILGRVLRLPVIGMGNAEEFTLAIKGKGWKNFIKRQWIKFTHKRAKGFIVVCHFCKDILISLGVNSDKIYVVPSSINPNKMHPIEDKTYDNSMILSVGRLVKRKGFHCLIKAVNQLKKEISDIKLNIVGNGPYREVLEKMVKDYRLEDNVFIKGEISDEELSELYRQSNLFVLAHMMLDNGDTEGCPTVFSEASGSGLPVIGGTDAGASTVIVEGKTGYIVNSRDISELANKIKKILTDSELAEKMGKAGIKKIKMGHVPKVTGPRFCAAIKNIVMDR